MKDALLKVTAPLPNAANTVNSNSIDLEQTGAFPVLGSKVTLRLSTSGGNGANSKNINIRVQHSDEAAANFTNVAELANPALRVAEANGTYADGEAEIALPPSTKRYIRAVALGEANGGDASNGTFTAELLFH